jgi:hypothetical protein
MVVVVPTAPFSLESLQARQSLRLPVQGFGEVS